MNQEQSQENNTQIQENPLSDRTLLKNRKISIEKKFQKTYDVFCSKLQLQPKELDESDSGEELDIQLTPKRKQLTKLVYKLNITHLNSGQRYIVDQRGIDIGNHKNNQICCNPSSSESLDGFQVRVDYNQDIPAYIYNDLGTELGTYYLYKGEEEVAAGDQYWIDNYLIDIKSIKGIDKTKRIVYMTVVGIKDQSSLSSLSNTKKKKLVQEYTFTLDIEDEDKKEIKFGKNSKQCQVVFKKPKGKKDVSAIMFIDTDNNNNLVFQVNNIENPDQLSENQEKIKQLCENNVWKKCSKMVERERQCQIDNFGNNNQYYYIRLGANTVLQIKGFSESDASYQRDTEKDMEIQMCHECLEEEANVVLLPCDHEILCEKCLSLLVQNGNQVCKYCRKNFDEWIQVTKYC